MKLKRIEAAILSALIITMAVSISGFAGSCENIRGEVLRLHVLANSDSDEDQNLKLKVRDRLLKEGSELFEAAQSVEEAEKSLEPELKNLSEAAKDEIISNGYDYDVQVTLDKEYFDTRTYDNITLPAGNYLALKVVIGEGKGKNWWCVMFPQICLPAAEKGTAIDTVLDDGELNVVESDPEYEIRFKIVEIYENLKNKLAK